MLEPKFQPDHQPEEEGNKLSFDLQLQNPFPGLRPFQIGENHLFFGRETHADEILLKLSENRFVSVLGYSGSGKSSLMYCGVIPILYGGFMTESGPDWIIAPSRPGSNPISNLAASILEATRDVSIYSEMEYRSRRQVLESLLKSGPDGMNEAFRHAGAGSRQNYLIIVDQFEEIFRLRAREESGIEVMEETSQYVDILLHAIRNSEYPVYLAITMRSDFVGDCSVFESLTTLINQSNYLVPQMNRDHKRMAIKGPVAVGGGHISDRLMKRLMEEVGDNQDQLPILQHAMMRTWDYWVENRDEDEPLDLRHYNAIGKISGALSQHADEIYDELNRKEKDICEVLFKELTQKGQDNKGMRRPARLGNVAKLAGVGYDEVIEVVDAFRKPGRSFLMPAYEVELDEESVIEISHESLMRIWVRLRNWVEEEHESAQMYLRLSEAAEMYQIGRTGLWRPPDLQLALNWQKKQKPNRLWARRYDEAFERAITFLDTSRITYEAEQRNQEMSQKRLLRRTRIAAITLGAAFIIAIVFFIFGVIQQNQAEANLIQAQINLEQSTQNERLAEIARESADSAARVAQDQRQIALQRSQDLEEANQRLSEALNNLQVALQNERVAQDRAEQERDRAVQQTEIAQREKILADSAFRVASRNFEEKSQLLYLIIAQSMAAKAVNVEDANLQGILAFQAYQFNREHEGRDYDPYVYNALHASRVELYGQTYNTLSAHQNAVTSVEFPNDSDVFYSTGIDGRVVRSDFSERSSTELASSSFRNKIIEISPDDRYLVSGGDSTFINVFSLYEQESNPRSIKVNDSYLNDIEFLPDGVTVITVGGDKTIRKVNISTGAIEILNKGGVEYKVVAVSENGQLMAAGGMDGAVTVFDMESGEQFGLPTERSHPVFSLDFNPAGNWLAVGDESGHAEIWNMKDRSKVRNLVSHRARVSDVEFSPDGKLLATGSWDRTINIWVVDELNELPITLTDNDAWVMDLDFSPDGGYLLAACNDGEIRIWTTSIKELAQNLCERLQRNMTNEEWENYVGYDIDYEETCPDIGNN